MKAWWRRVRPFIISGLVYRVARFIGATTRLRMVGAENLEGDFGKIVSGWHGHSLIPANYLRNKGVWVMISHSRDGEMQTRIFKRLGFNVARGSTGRGGERAAIELIRVLRKGGMVALTPDGPRGPSEVVQNGVMVMAQKSGAALIPVGTHARPAYRVPTWDRYLVPCPFGRTIFVVGAPIFVPREASAEEVEALRVQLEDAIKEMQSRAEREL